MRNELSENELDMVNGGGVMDSIKEFWNGTQDMREASNAALLEVAKWGLAAAFGPLGIAVKCLVD